jgi:hypothetical protein
MIFASEHVGMGNHTNVTGGSLRINREVGNPYSCVVKALDSLSPGIDEFLRPCDRKSFEDLGASIPWEKANREEDPEAGIRESFGARKNHLPTLSRPSDRRNRERREREPRRSERLIFSK